MDDNLKPNSHSIYFEILKKKKTNKLGRSQMLNERNESSGTMVKKFNSPFHWVRPNRLQYSEYALGWFEAY